ncbi:hypothetical protein Ark11_0716 [Candidatus Ichthyocystis hellenicum]|uniref:Uncharacterized protein n=1 Tax=Candidatus Ichthyocystis hellenicum TaxID=1561003 RepID=A0A0S4M3H6_9BURK|nr:hypothetical protein Ark11_0716 [Candidatus Ichthyocystis hellenicum]
MQMKPMNNYKNMTDIVFILYHLYIRNKKRVIALLLDIVNMMSLKENILIKIDNIYHYPHFNQ